jgi:endonuclease IV
LADHLCIENMDSRRVTGRTAKELRDIFEKLPEAKLCFDVAHARQVDPTMTEAVRILAEFGDRLAQVHLSEVNSKGKHFAMSFAAKLAYEPFADVLSRVPVILESPVDESEIEAEIEEARKMLASKHRAPQRAA